MAIKTVALIGANGRLGPALLRTLIDAGSFAVTVLTRTGSKSTYPDNVRIAYIASEPTVEELSEVLQGQDAVVVAFQPTNAALQIRYADAAAKAGVRRIIPADFGSCDSSSQQALDLIPLFRSKQQVRQHLQQLARQGQLSWTSLVTGHFLDVGLNSDLLQFDVKARKVILFDGGNKKFSTTTTSSIGLAVVRVLQHEEETKNRMLYVQDVCVSQHDILRCLEGTWRESWSITHKTSEEYIRETQAKLSDDPDNNEEWENMVSVLGIIDSNWESKKDFANHLLGLGNVDLETLVKKSVEM